jgi:hypothetical protein
MYGLKNEFIVKSEEIDWSKAPEGCTHYDLRDNSSTGWTKKINDGPYRYWDEEESKFFPVYIPDKFIYERPRTKFVVGDKYKVIKNISGGRYKNTICEIFGTTELHSEFMPIVKMYDGYVTTINGSRLEYCVGVKQNLIKELSNEIAKYFTTDNRIVKLEDIIAKDLIESGWTKNEQ